MPCNGVLSVCFTRSGMMAGYISIVAATDLSTAGDRAVRRAAELTSSLGGALQLIHVLPPRDMLAGLFPSQTDNEIAALRTRVGVALQDRVHLVAASFAVTPSWTLLHGRAHRAILDAVESFRPISSWSVHRVSTEAHHPRRLLERPHSSWRNSRRSRSCSFAASPGSRITQSWPARRESKSTRG